MHCRLPRFASFPDLFVKGTLDDFLKMFFFWSKKIFSVFSKFNDRAGKFTTFGVVDQSVQLVSPHFLGFPNVSSFTFFWVKCQTWGWDVLLVFIVIAWKVLTWKSRKKCWNRLDFACWLHRCYIGLVGGWDILGVNPPSLVCARELGWAGSHYRPPQPPPPSTQQPF